VHPIDFRPERTYSALPDLLVGLRGPTSKGRGGEGRERKRMGRACKGKGGEGNEGVELRKHPSVNSSYAPGIIFKLNNN